MHRPRAGGRLGPSSDRSVNGAPGVSVIGAGWDGTGGEGIASGHMVCKAPGARECRIRCEKLSVTYVEPEFRIGSVCMYTQLHIYLSPWPVTCFIRSRWHHGRGSFGGWMSLSQGEAGLDPAGVRGGGGELRVSSRGGVRGCMGTGEGGVVRDGHPAARFWAAGGGRRAGRRDVETACSERLGIC